MTVSVMSWAALGLGSLDNDGAGADAAVDAVGELVVEEEHPTTSAPTTRKIPAVLNIPFTLLPPFHPRAETRTGRSFED
jgi:hypothetical protein